MERSGEVRNSECGVRNRAVNWRERSTRGEAMSVDAMMEEIGKLDTESRLELAWKLWDSLEVEKAPTEPTAGQKTDLTRRMTELDANPDDVITHEELLASVRASR